MARPRGTPKTSFGAWLNSWLTEHPGYTLAAFGDEVGVTKSAVSLWLSGDTARIPIDRLRRIALITGEPVENLEQMVYGRRPPGDTAPAVGQDMLDAIEERLRAVLREIPGDYGSAEPAADPAAIRRRRAYWIQRARERLSPKGRKVMAFGEIADRMGLEGNTRDLVPLWANGTADPDPAYYERLARALHIPQRDIVSPPMTDEERLDRWAREFVEVETPEPTKIERRAS